MIKHKYYAIFWLSLKKSLVYRSNTALTLIVQALNLGVSLLMWHFILKDAANSTWSFQMMAQYLIMTNTLSLIFSVNPAFTLAKLVRSGELSNYLIRPLSLYWYLLFYTLGQQLSLLVLDLVLLIIMQVKLVSMLVLVGYLIVAFLMFFNLMLIIGSFSFWIIQMWQLRAGINAIYFLLGGIYFPLSYLGKSAAFLQYNPFSLVTDVPARFISQNGTFSLIPYFISCIIWLLIFMVIFKVIIKKGQAKYEGVSL